MAEPRQYRLSEASRIAGCSYGPIVKLIEAGKLPAVTVTGGGKGSQLRITASRSDIIEAVRKFSPRSGFKRGNGGKVISRAAARRPGGLLDGLAVWLALPQARRDKLIDLSDKCSDADLDLLLSL